MHFSRLLASLGLAAILGGLISGCAAPMPSPSATPTSTAAPTRTLTPTASAIPTDTPEQPSLTPHHVDGPAWLADPASSVVMFWADHTAGPGTSPATLAFVDAVSGQHFEMPRERPQSYFWLPDGRGFGYIDTDVHIVDSASGQVRQFAPGVLTRRFFDDGAAWPALASGTDPASADFFVFPAPNNYGRTELSDDHRFAAIISADDLIVEELQTGRQVIVPRTDPDVTVNSQWLPGGSVLTILRRAGEVEDPTGKLKTHRDFFDAAAGQMIASYPDTGLSGWSPDGEEVLYVNGGPCILKWRTGEHRCLDDGQDVHHADQVYRYAWSPDGTMISLAYWAGSGKQGVGGICVKHLDSGNMACPMLDHWEFNDGVVQDYGWSADSKYFLFYFSVGSCPGCDFEDSGHIGIISADGGTLHYPIDDLLVYPTDRAIWRPAIAPK